MEATKRVCKYCHRRLIGITTGPKDGPFNKRSTAIACVYCDKLQVRDAR